MKRKKRSEYKSCDATYLNFKIKQYDNNYNDCSEKLGD